MFSRWSWICRIEGIYVLILTFPLHKDVVLCCCALLTVAFHTPSIRHSSSLTGPDLFEDIFGSFCSIFALELFDQGDILLLGFCRCHTLVNYLLPCSVLRFALFSSQFGLIRLFIDRTLKSKVPGASAFSNVGSCWTCLNRAYSYVVAMTVS